MGMNPSQPGQEPSSGSRINKILLTNLAILVVVDILIYALFRKVDYVAPVYVMFVNGGYAILALVISIGAVIAKTPKGIALGFFLSALMIAIVGFGLCLGFVSRM
jgi:hypothetical protein